MMMKQHPYVEKFGAIMYQMKNLPILIENLESERSKIEAQLEWAESIDVDTTRLENNLNEITSCIEDIKEWKEEIA